MSKPTTKKIKHQWLKKLAFLSSGLTMATLGSVSSFVAINQPNSSIIHQPKLVVKAPNHVAPPVWADITIPQAQFNLLISNPESYNASTIASDSISLQIDIANHKLAFNKCNFAEHSQLINPIFNNDVVYQDEAYDFNTFIDTQSVDHFLPLPITGHLTAGWNKFSSPITGRSAFYDSEITDMTFICDDYDNSSAPVIFDFFNNMFYQNNHIKSIELLVDVKHHESSDLFINVHENFISECKNLKVFKLTETRPSEPNNWNETHKFVLNTDAKIVSFTDPNEIFDIETQYYKNNVHVRGVLGIVCENLVAKAFKNATNLAFDYLDIKQLTPQTIGEHAFYNCLGLHYFDIPANTTILADQAFYACKNLKTVELPSSIREWGSQVFYDCYNLTNLKFKDGFVPPHGYLPYDCLAFNKMAHPSAITRIFHLNGYSKDYWKSNIGQILYDWKLYLGKDGEIYKYNDIHWLGKYDGFVLNNPVRNPDNTTWDMDLVLGDNYKNRTNLEWSNDAPKQLDSHYTTNYKNGYVNTHIHLTVNDMVALFPGNRDVQYSVIDPDLESYKLTFHNVSVEVPDWGNTVSLHSHRFVKSDQLKVLYDGCLIPDDKYITNLTVSESAFGAHHSDINYIKTHFDEFITAKNTHVMADVDWTYNADGDFYYNQWYGSFKLTTFNYQQHTNSYDITIEFSKQWMPDQTQGNNSDTIISFKNIPQSDQNTIVYHLLALMHTNPMLTGVSLQHNELTIDPNYPQTQSAQTNVLMAESIPLVSPKGTWYYNTYSWMALNNQTLGLKVNEHELNGVNQTFTSHLNPHDLKLGTLLLTAVGSYVQNDFNLDYFSLTSNENIPLGHLPNLTLHVKADITPVVIGDIIAKNHDKSLVNLGDYVNYTITLPVSLIPVNADWTAFGELLRVNLDGKNINLKQIKATTDALTYQDENNTFNLAFIKDFDQINGQTKAFHVNVYPIKDLTEAVKQTMNISFFHQTGDIMSLTLGAKDVVPPLPPSTKLGVILGSVLGTVGFGLLLALLGSILRHHYQTNIKPKKHQGNKDNHNETTNSEVQS